MVMLKFFALLSCLITSFLNSDLDFTRMRGARLNFPKDFLFGVMQVGPSSELSKVHKQLPDDKVLDLIKPLGVNAYEFAVHWRSLEPDEGHFNEAEFEKLVNKCIMLKNAGISVTLVLHHYANPDWFNAKSGFEKAENCHYFIRFAKKVFEAVGKHVDMVCTFYQPAAYALEHFYRGILPPYKKEMQVALEVLTHMLDTHVAVYFALKDMAEGNRVQVGLIHHIMPIEPYHKANPLDMLAAYIAHKLNNGLVLDYFKTGKLHFTMPLKGRKYLLFAHINHENLKAPGALDFIGLSYISHIYIKNFKPLRDDQEIPMDGDLFTIYPEGLYDALSMVQALKKPIHILGNGIADACDKYRQMFLKQHLYVVNQAVADGCDVRSYFYRFLEDDLNDPLKFGLYEVEAKSYIRTLRPSAVYLIKVIQEFRSRGKK